MKSSAWKDDTLIFLPTLMLFKEVNPVLPVCQISKDLIYGVWVTAPPPTHTTKEGTLKESILMGKVIFPEIIFPDAIFAEGL